MSNLSHYEKFMKKKRAQTPFRTYLREIASWFPMVLYKRKEDISRYPDTLRAPRIVHGDLYDRSRDDLLLVGIEYDDTLSFFESYKKLHQRIPLPSRMVYINAENCDYAEAAWMSKNVYLSILAIGDCENILYTFYTQDNVKNVLNSVMVWDNSENIYFSTAVIQGYQVFYSKYIVNSSNIWFSTNLVGCRECIACENLENKEYCIENQAYPREEYFRKKDEILRNKESFLEKYISNNVRGENFGSKNVLGEFCIYSEDVENGYFGYRVKNARNILFVGDKDGRKDVYDTLCSDQKGEGNLYGCLNLGPGSNCYFSDCFIGHSLYYCFNCIECSFCLGCIGLKNKSYCILNKQYSKEEWERLTEKILASMEKDGTLGGFFPAQMNPFYFNDTMAYLIDGSFTKEEVEKEGYLWRDEPIRADIPEGASVISNKDLESYQGFDSEGKWNINPAILEKVISDEKGNYYRIVKMEYDFLMKHGLPLPTMHWLERMRIGLRFHK